MIIAEEIPTSVKIGAYEYDINTFEPMKGTKFGVLGTYHGINLEIEYQEDLPPQRVVGVLLHEIIHGMWDVSGLSREFGEDEEEHVLRLEQQLCDFIKKNPKFIAWMSQTLSDEDSKYILNATPVQDTAE